LATIVIQPVTTKTKGGFDAVVTGIDPTDVDFLKGQIDTPALGKINVVWDTNGLCRDNDPSCNLDVNDDETADVIDTAKKLGSA
jgi:hypothetical protein